MIKILCGEKDNGAYADLMWTKNVQQYNKGQVIYCREFAEGAVVSMREMNGYDDSDFYATYYDADAKEFKEACYATTRGWTYPARAVVDASPEILALYEAKQAADRAKAKAERDAVIAATPTVGKNVVVSLKSGKNKWVDGKVCEVYWYGKDAYSDGYRVGVKVDGVGLFLNAKNVTVVQ